MIIHQILLATGNPGKAREMREILAGVGEPGRPHEPVPRNAPPALETLGTQASAAIDIEWRYLSEFESVGWPEPVEDGATFAENAEIKARHYARLSGLWTIADDSGLVVDALGGEPGVRSARYAGEPKNDKANNALLIGKLAGVPAERRTARFRCAVAMVGAASRGLEAARPAECHNALNPGSGLMVLASAEGTVEGIIVDEPRGTNGFGYDPHFWVPAYGMTTAEMSPDVKHAISHRGQALRKLRERLKELVQT